MITFVTETISKRVYASQASRLNLCWLVLWVFAIVFPVLYLVSIGNLSWPITSYANVTPSISYENYEITYTDQSGNSSYYTNLQGRVSTGSTPPNVMGGGSSTSQLPIIINLRDPDISTISGILYLSVVLSGSVSNQFVGAVTFNLDKDSTLAWIPTASISYDLRITTSSPIPQNYQPSSLSNTLFTNPSSTMLQNIININQNSLGLVMENPLVAKGATAVSDFPTISINLNISEQRILVASSLLSQMREFWRHWVYVFIPVSWVVMFFLKKLVEIRVYPSRTANAEPKQKIL